jgi:class 3 adenylate cyclase/tetratricopeptide (TPR) repeat protein
MQLARFQESADQPPGGTRRSLAMKCPRCQQDNQTHARFCLGCGAHLTIACDSCGTELPGGARFCLQCGHAVAAGAAAPVRSPAPETYTPKYLAEKILTSKSALEGERKQVTVLFADLKGSMELLVDRDPEEARTLLDPVIERMMDAVHRYEGTVNQVMGDGIMALFGAPVAHEDHAVRACYAALRMQKSVKQHAEEVFRTHGVPLQIRVGLNSGDVVVRTIGSDLRMDYTAVGQTTHLAARMEQLATAGSILLTRETLRLVEGFVHVTSRGSVSIKGMADPVEVFELGIAPPTPRRFKAASARGLTRFVGRDAEMGQLYGALERARGGHGQVVAPVGEPGVGKSRLVWEFAHSRRTEGCLVLETGSVSYGIATPYLAVIDLLKGYFRLQEGDDHLEIQEKVIGKLLALDPSLVPALPPFLTLLDVPTDDSEWDTLDPPQRRQRTLDAIKRLLLRESQRQPLVLVFEDLHWIDSETQAVLDSLVESLPTARILLLVNYRPEYQHAWGSKSYCTQVPIDPLPPESAEELLQALLGADRGLHPLRRLLIDRTEGNPFFLEESLWMLVETHVLVGERGAYRLAKTLPAIQVPSTVQAVLAARIDRLPADEKQLVQSAAVVGKDVPRPLLQAVADLPEMILRRGLTHLQAAEFLYETRPLPDLEYTFKHALTHEVAYKSLLQEQRRVLHARIVEALEQLYPDRLTEHVQRLAHHAFRGEVWEKAVTYLRQAGAKALARSAYREAGTCFEQALVALQHLPDTREALELAIDLRFDLRASLFSLAEFGRILEELGKVEALAEALGDQQRLGRTFAYMAGSVWLMGDDARAIECGERALALGVALDDPTLQLPAYLYVGLANYSVGAYGQAIEFLRRMAALGDAASRDRFGMAGFPSVLARAWWAWCLAELGEFAEGVARGEEGLRIAEEADHAYSLASAYYGLGHVYLRRGDLQNAISVLECGRELCESADLRLMLVLVAPQLGYAYALDGRVVEAISELERALEQALSTGFVPLHSLVSGWLGEAYLRAGHFDEAIRVTQKALEISYKHEERGQQAWALRLLGEVSARPDSPDTDTAEGHYCQALALAGELGMRPLVAHCHLGLGKLYRRTGTREQTQAHLTTATTMYREMDMRFWLEQAEAELRAFG